VARRTQRMFPCGNRVRRRALGIRRTRRSRFNHVTERGQCGGSGSVTIALGVSLRYATFRSRTTVQLMVVERLREALLGVAERHVLGDPWPCYCVDSEPGLHDEWCEDARTALSETDGLPPDVRPRLGT
jgi:hypothetical protein